MAKSSNRGGGEGTSDRGGVRTTMSSPFSKGSNTGSQGTMSAPFDAPRAGGANGLPTKTYDTSMGGPSAGAKANRRDSLGTIETDPNSPRR